MKMFALTCAAALATMPAAAQELVIDMLPGHPVYHENEGEAGVVMALSITSEPGDAAGLQTLCEELRGAAGLAREQAANLPLEVIFVVPYKGMAIEGYYLPRDDSPGGELLIRGNDIPRVTLDGIVGRAGIPGRVLDESDIEHEISCELNEAAWLIRWQDVRLLEGAPPEAVIDQARHRFMAIYRSVVEHAAELGKSADLQRLGLNSAARGPLTP